MEILEIGADGTFDIPTVKVAKVDTVKAEKKVSAAIPKGQLEVLLGDISLGNYQVVNSVEKSMFVVLMRLHVGDTLVSLQYVDDRIVEALTNEEKKFRIVLPELSTRTVIDKSNITCNMFSGDSSNVVVFVPYFNLPA